MPMCECLCLHKDAQQVHLLPPPFHFVQQRACLCEWLLSESFAWSFFYVPLPQRAQHSQDLMIIGSSGHRERSETLVRVDTSHVWPEGDGSVHDTSVTGHGENVSSSFRPNGCQLSEGVRVLVSLRPVLMWNPLEVVSAKNGRSIDKAGGEVRQRMKRRCTVLSRWTC